MTENETAAVIVDASYKVHKTLGPGLLESVYESVLAYELQRRGVKVSRQAGITGDLRIGEAGGRLSGRSCSK